MKGLSNWQLRQWVVIKRVATYTFECRICHYSNGTDSKASAEELFRLHYDKEHTLRCARVEN